MARTFGDPVNADSKPDTTDPLHNPNIKPAVPLGNNQLLGTGGYNPAMGTNTTKPRELTSLDRIKMLEQMESHFIFPFGVAHSGKTVAMASLIHYMSGIDSQGKLHAWESPYAAADETQKFISEVNRVFSKKKFPHRTFFKNNEERTRQINVEFTPDDRSRESLRMTFVDMAGDDHQQFAWSDGATKLPPDIEIFFQARKLDITFMLVTRHQDASKDDVGMVTFLNHLIMRNSAFKHARVLILVSNWDTYSGTSSVSEFVQKWMPATYAKTRDPHNAMINFTIGSVGQVSEGGSDMPFIQEYDPQPAKRVLHWLYKSLTGQELNHVPFWKKFLKLV
jgi:hypothetical protein